MPSYQVNLCCFVLGVIYLTIGIVLACKVEDKWRYVKMVDSDWLALLIIILWPVTLPLLIAFYKIKTHLFS